MSSDNSIFNLFERALIFNTFTCRKIIMKSIQKLYFENEIKIKSLWKRDSPFLSYSPAYCNPLRVVCVEESAKSRALVPYVPSCPEINIACPRAIVP